MTERLNNETALELVRELADWAHRANVAAVWAEAFLIVGGEPTWDAVKGVSRAAAELAPLAVRAARMEEQFEEIIP